MLGSTIGVYDLEHYDYASSLPFMNEILKIMVCLRPEINTLVFVMHQL